LGAHVLEGVAVKIGRREYVVPPITMWWSEQLGKAEHYASERSTAELVLGLLSENYPDLTAEELMKVLPRTGKRLTATMKAIVTAAMADTEPAEGEASSP